MTAIAAIALAAGLAATAPTPNPNPANGWEVLYTIPDRSSAFQTVYATNKDTWAAGGPSVIVVQSDGVAQPHKIDRDVSYIAGTRFGVFAVGSRGTVWSIRGGTLREEHRLAGPRKVRDPMTLDWLESGTVAGRTGVLAFGTALMLFGADNGKWSTVAETEAVPLRKALLYDRGADVKGCGGRTWIPLRDGADTGFLACDDRRTFDGSASMRSHPRLPKDCPRPYSAARAFGANLAVLCDDRRPWLLVDGADGWKKMAAPAGTVQIHTAGSCIFAATARSIWRTCGGLETTPTSR